MRRRAANWFNSLQTMLRLQLPAWLVFAIATLVEHPASLILLLVGNAITMTAVCRALGFDLDGAVYRLSALCDSLEARQSMAKTALTDLALAGIALGRLRVVGE